MRKKTFIFDLDGTLVDTIVDIAEAANAVLKNNNYPEQPVPAYAAIVGWGIDETIKKALPKVVEKPVFDRLVAEYKSYYKNTLVSKAVPYPGLTQVLEKLSAKGVLLYVLTNKDERTSITLMEKLFKGISFEMISGITEKNPIFKPDTRRLLPMINGKTKEDILFIGDTEIDIKTAAAAGIDMVGVTWGYRSRKELEAAGCHHFIDKGEELLAFV